MNSINIKVNDFKVEFKQSECTTDVEVYVDGNLNEDRQRTWYLRKLLDEAIQLKEDNNEWRKAYEKLESIARDYIDNELLDELLEEY